jgi:DNA-binding NtrC family response regulator
MTEKPARIRVAIAEDDQDLRSALAACLRAAGYLVTETHDGRELLDVLQGTPPGFFKIVIADHRMPRLRGLECLERAGGRAPFVLVSGTEEPSFRASAARFGAAAVLRKPVDFDALLLLVRDLLVRELIRKPRGQPSAVA